MADEQFAQTVASQLAVIEDKLLEATVSQYSFVTNAADHVISAGGKRFRPAMVVTAAHLGDHFDVDRLVSAALVMELTHVASLYHDDVMDEAELRRGVTSANQRYGNSTAILVGDYLFAKASSQVATLGVDYVDLQARTFAELVEGQMAETAGPGPGEDPVDHHFKVLAGKTASLIRTSAVFGGMIAGVSDESLAALARFGFEIGMVFQLSDDLIDIVSEKTGKTPGTDLREGVPTLPTLLLASSDDAADRQLARFIAGGLDDDAELAKALAALRASSVIDQTRDEITRRADNARGYLAPLPDCDAKDALARLCDEVVTRSS